MLDVERIRRDFPILCRQVHGKPLVFLDSAASSQKPLQVLAAMEETYRQCYANVHRGVYTLSEEATCSYEEARDKVASFINARAREEIIFTRNTTESINLVAYTWGRTHIGPGDRILLTEMEHHSNIVPWQLLAQEKGAELVYLPITDEGFLDLDRLDDLLDERVKLVAFTMMSNVLGTIIPVKEIVEKAHQVGAIALVDGAQAVPHMPVDVQDLGCDFLAFSGHKMCGPTGIGVLYGREELLEEMPPFLGGGDMIRRVELDHSTWNDLPWKFEAGTPAIVEGIGLGAAVDYLTEIGMEAIAAHEQEVVAYAMERLSALPGLKIVGPPAEHRGGVIAFTFRNIHPHDLAHLLDLEGIAVRAGHHCAQPLHRRLGLVATTRASFYLYNTSEEADRLAEALEKVARIVGK
ncbi:MAG TPA: cysteine desulfurase [Thermoflexia bacterium]|jgi:cysteine desulfurase/selenocysteine lyase|nr:cysteine desulfurase [Thermoflexia bacterium]